MNKKDIWMGMAVWVFLLFCPMMLMGQPHCTRELTKETQYTRTHNVLYAYGPDRYWKEERDFMLRYPGDNYVELIGFDDYSIGSDEVALRATISRAKIVSKLAEQHQKVAALFETANSKETTSDRFFRDFLQPIIQADSVKLGLVQL